MANNGNPHSGHRGRMWNKFSRYGIDVFDEHEILETLLYLMLPRVNTNTIAHRLIEEFGTLKNVLFAPCEELQRIDGIGKSSALQMNFVGAVANYMNLNRIVPKECFSTTKTVIEYCINHFKNEISENFTLLLLDDKYALLHVHEISCNTPNHIVFEYREVLAQIMKYDCRKVVIAHNHTIGTTDPSDDDLRLTRELSNILKMINVGLVDHIIVHNDTAVSLRKSGMLSNVWES